MDSKGSVISSPRVSVGDEKEKKPVPLNYFLPLKQKRKLEKAPASLLRKVAKNFGFSSFYFRDCSDRKLISKTYVGGKEKWLISERSLKRTLMGGSERKKSFTETGTPGSVQ